MTAPITNRERLPQAIADQLDSLVRAHEYDPEICRSLRICREQLRVLSWSRFRARHERGERLANLCRRHKGHRKGHRLAPEGRLHA
jgi:hypothetical protein